MEISQAFIAPLSLRFALKEAPQPQQAASTQQQIVATKKLGPKHTAKKHPNRKILLDRK